MLRLNYEMIMLTEPCYDPVAEGYIDEHWKGTMQDVLLATDLPPFDAVWVAVNDEFLPNDALNDLEQIVLSSIGEARAEEFKDAMISYYPGPYKAHWSYGWNLCTAFVWAHSGKLYKFAGFVFDRYDQMENIQWQVLRGILLYLYTKYT